MWCEQGKEKELPYTERAGYAEYRQGDQPKQLAVKESCDESHGRWHWMKGTGEESCFCLGTIVNNTSAFVGNFCLDIIMTANQAGSIFHARTAEVCDARSSSTHCTPCELEGVIV